MVYFVRTIIISFLFFLPNISISQTSHSTFATQQPISDSLPHAVGWTNDFEHLFTKDQIRMLDSSISSFEHKTKIEISIITIDSSLTDQENFDEFVNHIFHEWGVGKKELNNGIVIGISKQFRKMRIRNGAGIVNILSDVETKKIIDNDFIPMFKKGDYFEGTLNGLQFLMATLKKKQPVN